jgi:hypothetical protein
MTDPVRAYIDSKGYVHPDVGAPPDTRVLLVPEELWDRLFPATDPAGPRFPEHADWDTGRITDIHAEPSDLELRMWAVEQAVNVGDVGFGAGQLVIDRANNFIAYVKSES